MVVPIGALLSIFPIAAAYKRVGFRYSKVVATTLLGCHSRTFAFCLALSAVTGAVIPLCATAKQFALVVVLRLVQGE